MTEQPVTHIVLAAPGADVRGYLRSAEIRPQDLKPLGHRLLVINSRSAVSQLRGLIPPVVVHQVTAGQIPAYFATAEHHIHLIRSKGHQ